MIALAVVLVVVLSVVVEAVAARSHEGEIRGYSARDTWASLSLLLGHLPLRAIATAAAIPIYFRLWATAPFKLPDVWWTYVAGVFVWDLLYYFTHRVHHEVQAFWAAHEAHHSSTHFNLSTGLRLAWWEPLSTLLFFGPMALAGFSHLVILVAATVNVLYQFFLHTELVGRLGLLEYVFNTPSHHRVHHGSDAPYVGRNLGGILIVWDFLFRSFAWEKETPTYGLAEQVRTHNPLRLAFREGWRTFVGFWRAKGLKKRWAVLAARPIGAMRPRRL